MNSQVHWTEARTEDFLYKISADFVAQLEREIERLPRKQAEVAEKLGVSEGRVSQIINNPGNLTLKVIIRFARALGLKVAIVAYSDGDDKNEKGPINSDVFRVCWENAGRPRNFRFLREWNATNAQTHPPTLTAGSAVLAPNVWLSACAQLAQSSVAAYAQPGDMHKGELTSSSGYARLQSADIHGIAVSGSFEPYQGRSVVITYDLSSFKSSRSRR